MKTKNRWRLVSAVFICTLLLGGTGCAGSEMDAAEKPDLNNHSQMDGSTSAPEKDDALVRGVVWRVRWMSISML